MSYYKKPDPLTKNVFNRGLMLLMKAGVSIRGSRILYVRGRKSGAWRTNPVNPLTFDGQRYLVAPRGETEWVRNIRAAGGGELRLGSKRELFRVEEIADEEKPRILRAYLKHWSMEAGMFFQGVKHDSPEEDVRRIAPLHPVFRIVGA
jgi:deazaflavin-dependent oxidoreductase (nitroreductase family)